jgi:cholinesterase
MPKVLMHAALALGLLAPAIVASPILRIYTYGDSLSDRSFSNGPVAVELLADRLRLPASGRVNYAVGGATTGVGNLLDGGTVTTASPRGGMTTQLNDTIATLMPEDAMFVVWGGPNDFLAPDPSDIFPDEVVVRAVNNLADIVQRLQAAGAEHILVPGLPNLGLTPYYLGLPSPAAEQATALSIGFNDLLKARLPPGVIYFDTAGLMQQVVDDPAAFGFTNVTGSCLTTSGACSNPNQYLFWDGFHPTTAAHQILAERFHAAVVPEPATVLLVLGGIAPFAIVRRVRSRRRRRM